MKKIIKSAICGVTALAVIVPCSIFAVRKNAKAVEGQTTAPASVVSSTSTAPETTTVTTTTTTAKTNANAKKSNGKKPTNTGKTKTTTTTTQKKKTPKVNYVYKKSELLKNVNSVRRWNASNGKMSVKAEQVELKLNKYVDGKKTNDTVKKYAYVAVIKGTPDGFKSIAANQSTGKPADTVLNIAEKANAVFAVNGEMCNHNTKTFKGFFNAADDSDNGTVIKNGRVAQSVKTSPSLAMYKNGKWEYPVFVSPDNTAELISNGVITTMSYTYPVLWNGKPYITEGNVIAPMWNERDTVDSDPQNHFYNDHTLIGQIDKNTYVVAISDGFGRGFLCDIMQELGVQNAFWANGGHCSSMYIKGYGVVNRVGDKKLCLAADIMYF